MKNEPVAWINEHGEISIKEHWAYPTPLYTHPVKELDRELLDKTIIDQQNEIKELRKNLDVALMIVNKPELTDEEIREFMAEMPHLTERKDLLMFARAILRKAQEK